jgi:DNA-binding response OmpR family regulator
MVNRKLPKYIILIVDDNKINMALLSKVLKNSAYKIIKAESGEEALKKAEKNLPHLILLDILMAGIDGFQTFEILKQNEKTKDIPVIFMTALGEIENKARGLGLGAVDYITKPFHNEEVLLRVQNHLLINDLKNSLQEKNIELEKRLQKEKSLVLELKKALNEVKTLTGLLPICAWCKNIRDDKGYWKKIETYISERTDASFTHGICNNCEEKIKIPGNKK